MHARQEIMSTVVRVPDEEEADVPRHATDESLRPCTSTPSDQSSVANEDAVSHVDSHSVDEMEPTADCQHARCPSTPPTNSSNGILRKRTPDDALSEDDDSRPKRHRRRNEEQPDGAVC